MAATSLPLMALAQQQDNSGTTGRTPGSGGSSNLGTTLSRLGSTTSNEAPGGMLALCGAAGAGLASSCTEGIARCLEGATRGRLRLPSRAQRGPGRGACSEEEFRRRIEFLGQVTLFKRLPMSNFPILARELRGVCWEAGQVILECDQQLTEFAIVAEGWAEVQAEGPSGSASAAQLLWPGDYFGERVLQQGVGGKAVRSPVRVVAGPGLVTLSMSPKEFEDFGLRQHLKFPKRRALSRCMVQHTARVADISQKSEEQRKFIAEALRGNANLRSLINLQESLVQEMCDSASRKEVKAGSTIVRRGEYGGMFYIVESGSFELRLNEGSDDGGAASTADALSRAKSGAVVCSKAAKAANPFAANSETHRRRDRKERFLQKLAHTQDLDGGASPSGASCTPNRRPIASPQRSVKFHRQNTLTLQRDEQPQEVARCKSAYVAASSNGPASSPKMSGAARRAAFSTTTQFHSCESLSTEDTPATGYEMTSSSSFPQMLDPSPVVKVAQFAGAGAGDASCHSRTLSESPTSVVAKAGDSCKSGKVLGVRRRGECFGELALLYHAPRTSDAVAREDSVVWCVSQAQFRRIMGCKRQDKIEQIVSMLGKVDLLQGLLMQERLEVAQNFLTAKFKQGDWLIHKGETQEVWYIITSGECVMTRPKSEFEDQEEVLGTLPEHQHFGERALLRGRPSEFSVRAASSEVECLVLDGPTFKELAGHLTAEDFRRAAEDDLMEFAKYKKQRNVKLQGFLSKLDLDGANSGRTPRRSNRSGAGGGGAAALTEAEEVVLDPAAGERTLTRKAVLGKGAFGLVTLEQDPLTAQRFALKTVFKRHIEQNKLQQAIRLERQILTMVDSPFIVRLHATFRDANYLYFLFEPLLGGELHNRMCREPSRFRDVRVHRFLIGCVILALEHLHQRNIVYRDLKPENVLLDASGYVKLCDMGFAKFIFGKTATLCGTPEYMAPEVILHGGYDRMVDWWAIGILTYEFVCGCTPFIDDEEEETRPEVIFANILTTREQEMELPSRIPVDTADFIESLLQFSPGNRLGSGGAAQVKAARFFAGQLDFQALAQQKVVPVYAPRVKSDGELARTLQKTVFAPCEGGGFGQAKGKKAAPVALDEDDWDDIF